MVLMALGLLLLNGCRQTEDPFATAKAALTHPEDIALLKFVSSIELVQLPSVGPNATFLAAFDPKRKRLSYVPPLKDLTLLSMFHEAEHGFLDEFNLPAIRNEIPDALTRMEARARTADARRAQQFEKYFRSRNPARADWFLAKAKIYAETAKSFELLNKAARFARRLGNSGRPELMGLQEPLNRAIMSLNEQEQPFTTPDRVEPLRNILRRIDAADPTLAEFGTLIVPMMLREIDEREATVRGSPL